MLTLLVTTEISTCTNNNTPHFLLTQKLNKNQLVTYNGGRNLEAFYDSLMTFLTVHLYLLT